MAKLRERAIELTSGGLTLEGALHEGDGSLAAVMLHPHPQYGGDMHNHVVLGVCGAFAERHASTLRFNFRGTGRSQGGFDGGRGETDDARAALARMRALQPGVRTVLAGYSFGAVVAARAAQQEDLAGLVLISPPAAMMALPVLCAEVRTLLITGERDAIAPPASLEGYASEAHRVVSVPDVDHGWWPGLDRLAAEVDAFIGGLIRDVAAG